MAARCWAHLDYNNRDFGDNYFMVCIPMDNHEKNFFQSFRRHYLEKRESY